MVIMSAGRFIFSNFSAKSLLIPKILYIFAVAKLTKPCGGTPRWDAIGKGIKRKKRNRRGILEDGRLANV